MCLSPCRNLASVVKAALADLLGAIYHNDPLEISLLLVCSLLVEDWSLEILGINILVESCTRSVIGMILSGLAAIFIP